MASGSREGRSIMSDVRLNEMTGNMNNLVCEYFYDFELVARSMPCKKK